MMINKVKTSNKYSKLKVAVVIPTHFNVKSSLHVLLNAYGCLIKTKDLEVSIFTDSRNNVSYPGFKIVKVHGIDYKTPIEKALLLFGLPRYFYTDLIEKLKGYDVIDTSNPEFYMFAMQSYMAAKKYNARLILRTSQTVEGFFLFKISKFLVIPFAKKAYSYASSLVFTNPEAAQRCIRLGLSKDEKKFILVGHGVDTSVFKPLKVKKDKNKKILLSVAGLYKIKGHQLIIKALKKIIDKGHKNTELWIAGEGYYKDYLKKLSQELGVEKNVKFLGALNKKKLSIVYNKSDVFALANYQEITPSVNEAYACGIPAVVMECGGRKFVIPNESYGLVSKKFDVDDMAEKIIKLMTDEKLAKNIAKNGRGHILREFSSKAYSEKLYKAIRSKNTKLK